MASFTEMLLGGTAAGVGFVVGAAGALMGAQRLRPVAREAIKGYLVAAERAREATAELAETMEDLCAEARTEHDAQSGRGAQAG